MNYKELKDLKESFQDNIKNEINELINSIEKKLLSQVIDNDIEWNRYNSKIEKLKSLIELKG